VSPEIPKGGTSSGRLHAMLPWAMALASGGMMALCFAPAGWGNLCWVALVPLVCAVWFPGPRGRCGWCRAAGIGYVFGAVFFGASLFWLTTLTVPGWLALALLLAIYPAVWAVLLDSLARPRGRAGLGPWLGSLDNLRACALGAAAWVALEWLRGVLFPQFPWNSAGIALGKNIPLIQIADITGVGGISFLVVMANLMAVASVKRLLVEIRLGARRPHYDFAVTVALVVLAWGYGFRQMAAPAPAATDFTFAAVQPNIPQKIRNDPASEPDVLARLARHTATAFALRPDIILWPESATPRPLFNDQATWDTVRGLAAEHAGDFLLGTIHFSDRGDFNSVAMLTARGGEAQMYHKMHLVPFGEYIPLRNAFPLFAWIVGDLVPGDFDPGPYPVVLEMSAKPVKLGPLICFEDVLGDLARQFALRGAQAFAVVTNDGWFLASAGSRQHLAHAVFRCAENKIPMVRAANSGVTCAVDRFGAVKEILQNENGDTFVEGVLFGKVSAPVSPVPTFYARNGEVFSIACLAATALAGAGFLRTRRRGKISACPPPSKTEP
jgi:apolipoprotein N-acyltransferase